MSRARRTTRGRFARKPEAKRGPGRELLLGAVGLAAAYGFARARRGRNVSLDNQVALVTGGSRGLGLLLARELGKEGCRVAICARDPVELERARLNLANSGVVAFCVPADVSDRLQIEQAIVRTVEHYGGLDILVNNAGVIQVGPLDTMTVADFEQAMAVNFWGTLYASLAGAAAMRAGGGGRIVNVTSIGGRVAVPHLLPYDCAKFAAMGLSEGLRTELAPQGISVTTVIPGLMRTGSHASALFKGATQREYEWFRYAASARVTSMDPRRAARRIVLAAKRREAEVVLGWQAHVLRMAHSLFPGLVSSVMGTVSRYLLPAAVGRHAGQVRGRELAAASTQAYVDKL